MSAYRSREPGGHVEGLDALEAQLRRSVRRRRLVTGFLALLLGLASLVVGVLLLVETFAHSHRRGLIRTSALMILGGASLVVVAFVILRVGDLKQGSVGVVAFDPIPWSTLAGVSGALLVGIALVAAWPLGIYGAIAGLASPCRKVLTAADAERLGLAPFVVGQVSDAALVCSLAGLEPATQKRVVRVTIAADKGGSQLANELRFLGGARTPIAGLGDEAYLVERDADERVVVVRRRHAALFVHLATRLYDRDAALRIAEHLKGKTGLIEPYADAWKKRYGGE